MADSAGTIEPSMGRLNKPKSIHQSTWVHPACRISCMRLMPAATTGYKKRKSHHLWPALLTCLQSSIAYMLSFTGAAHHALLPHSGCAGMTYSCDHAWDDIFPPPANQVAENPTPGSSQGEYDSGRQGM